ncbi:MAG TPA: choice-of-anchor D domain-containing protein, partial [Thermomicrobiales bacterium]|nr:choice-of-anchor D domain-containing protein [Thermomicrobiales bacterium]
MSLNPSSATFASTLVESVSASQTFTVRNDGPATVALAALQGTNAADFRVLSNGCGATLQPGASCDVAIAFAPTIRSGSRSASLAITSSANPTMNASLTGMALPSLTLLAGAIGGPGYADGTGADARFFYPAGVAADGAGNLYVADSSTYSIRKIVIATGAVTTLAGTPRQPGTADGIGLAAGFTDLKAITADRAGNLYVIDDHGIRKIAIATAAVTTVADDGGGSLHLDGPVAITTDGTGTLYVADMNPTSSFL